MLFQQLCGVKCCYILYKTAFFQKAGSDLDPHYSTIIIGAIQVLAVFVSTLIVDRIGRKILLLVSIIFLALTTCALGVFSTFKKTRDLQLHGYL